jgi:hypothetical protein
MKPPTFLTELMRAMPAAAAILVRKVEASGQKDPFDP